MKEPVGWIEDILGALGLHGNVLGVVTVVVGLAFIFGALFFIARNMRELVAERVERSFNRLLGRSSGLIAMTLGLIVTMTVQSSSITTSILIPLAASGILTLENAYPVSLGANVGTTITALLAALATDSSEALTIALVHTLFNVTGIVMFYPLPFLRNVPLRLSRGLADLAVTNRGAVVGYVGGLFIVLPLVGILIVK
ncbi:MAG: Na/Pi symporter [Acidimicrobiia bacterium]|nr:Na/Pi symporter [Acidimicrobiia bacterium]